MRVKICGITQIEQGRRIAELGADSLGFICVAQSPRYISPDKIKAIAGWLPVATDRVGVFVNSSIAEIAAVVSQANLTAVQLHGAEPPEFCLQLRQAIAPEIELIKAFRVKSTATLTATADYSNCVDTLLLDAYHPGLHGGTGKTLNWQDLNQFKPAIPWMLAGGLTPDNVTNALSRLQPDGIDLSSGVERSPGDKDLTKVAQLFQQLAIKHQSP